MSEQKNGLDLSALSSATQREEDGQELHITDVAGNALTYTEDGETKPVVFIVAGSYSSFYRKKQLQLSDRNLRKRTVGDAARIDQNLLELAASCVRSWRGVTNNGTPIDCSEQNVIAILRAAPWIRRQVEEAMEDHASFFGLNSND